MNIFSLKIIIRLYSKIKFRESERGINNFLEDRRTIFGTENDYEEARRSNSVDSRADHVANEQLPKKVNYEQVPAADNNEYMEIQNDTQAIVIYDTIEPNDNEHIYSNDQTYDTIAQHRENDQYDKLTYL